MNTQALFCLSLPLVIAGCAQQTSTSTARDSAFAQSLRPPVFSDIYQRSPEVTRSGRYTLVSVKSADAQREPLNQLIDITMPGQLVNSVGDGFRYLLFQSGYSLCGRYGADFAELLKRPLPAVQRKIGPMRLSEALQVVAGPAWRMSVDEVNREVCFVLRDAYLAQAKTTASATPTLKSSDTAGVYVSPETSRNPYTGVLPGKNAVPVVAGQLLTSKKDTAQKPVSEFLPVPALQLPATSVKSVGAPVSATAPAPRNPFTGENLTGTTMPVPASPSPVGGKPDVSTPAPSTATPVKPANNGRIPLDQLGGAVDRAGVTATPLVLSGLRWQGKLSGLLDMIAARTGLTPRMDNGAILFSLLETRTFQFTFLNTNITSNASVTSGSTSSMGTSGGTTNSSVSGDSSSSQQTTVDQSRNVYDDMKKTLETMLTPQKGRFWLSASTGTLTVTDNEWF